MLDKFIFLFISFFFVLIFSMFFLFLNFYHENNLETKTFFECGFESLQTYRYLFSLRFFVISIIFLIFDMEMMFVLPMVFFYTVFKFLLFFIYIILMLGLYLEWNQGGLHWK